jgi:putative FmdB family regulatory protein
MPVYEFTCNGCGARVSLFTRSITSEVKGVCDRCGSADLQRIISKVAILRAPMDPSKLNKQELLDGVDYTNPASMAQFLRKMGDTFQDDQNDYMDDIIGRLDHGERVEHALGMDDHFHGHSEPAGGEGDSGGGDD